MKKILKLLFRYNKVNNYIILKNIVINIKNLQNLIFIKILFNLGKFK